MTSKSNKENAGKIVTIDGPVIGIEGFIGHKIGDLVKIGHKMMTGEIIKILGKKTITQCFDYTDGLRINEPAENTGFPLSMELAPGLLNTIFDGIQRPLDEFIKKSGDFIQPGLEIPALSRTKKWHFEPIIKVGESVGSGDIIGSVKENEIFSHKIMVPFGTIGKITFICEEGTYDIEHKLYSIQTENKIKNFNMLQKWPIRNPRPYQSRIYPDSPLITGMRVIDLLFPVVKGGAVAIPGGFGTGKTVIQHNLAKWSDADIIVYIGCGERGNEMADVLEQFPNLVDPRTNRPIMERTVLIGNTSNMPVSAREASIFSGLTIAEYFRDMGLHVALLADSTSRWAEALRELSGRLEEMPAEGGYPAYLATRLANFYERAGYVITHGLPPRKGSITIVGAISPPSGDFSEPITKSTKRFIRAFWALDAKLAYSRHYPAILWTDSYSLYGDGDYLIKWWNKIEKGWGDARSRVSEILSQSDQLQNVVQLIGKENIPRNQQLILLISDLIKQTYLIQSAFDEIDRYCSPKKSLKLIKNILLFYDRSIDAINHNIPLFEIRNLSILNKISSARMSIKNSEVDKIDEMREEIIDQFNELIGDYHT
ncbi:MAG: V-type ATP synthase subunit A [Promethearchaeota archaeon]